MKEIIKFLLEEQGLSYGTLSLVTGIKRYKLYEMIYRNKNYLNEKEINLLKSRFDEGSYKHCFEPIEIDNRTNKRYLKTSSILPRESRRKCPLFYKDVDENKIEIWYQSKQGRGMKSIFPKEIELDEYFFMGLGLSLGDGLNNPCVRNTHYIFANTNFDLVHFIYLWLNRSFNLDGKRFQLFLNLSKNRDSPTCYKEEVKRMFPQNNLRCYYLDRFKYPTLNLQLSDPIFQLIYLNLFKKLKMHIFRNKLYRGSLLKGLFAAEGHVKHSVYGTIEGIGFAFNAKTEVGLARFIAKSLKKEGITVRIKKKEGYLYLCGYENMLRFYLLGLMDLHKNKKDKFIRLTSNAHAIIHLRSNSIDKLRKFKQNYLAEVLGVSQPSISEWINKRRVPVVYLSKIMPLLGLKSATLINHIDYIGVSNSKIRDRNSVKFLLESNRHFLNKKKPYIKEFRFL